MLVRVAVAIVSLYAIYVVGINVFLSTSLFNRVINTQDPDSVFVTFRRGWSVWPGHIHARDLLIRGGDRHVQWTLAIDQCEFTLSFYDLAASKKFHVKQVHGAGIAFDARQRIEAPLLTEKYLASLPVIPGFDRLPMEPDDPPNLNEKWEDADYHLWTVELENVIADDVRRVWIDTMRFDGHARIVGGFYLKPIRDVRVGPIHLTLEGTASMWGLPVVQPAKGSVDLTIERFDPRTISLADLTHRISGGVDIQGRVPDLANIPGSFFWPAKVTGSADLRRLDVRVARGRVTDGTHLDVVAPRATVEVADHRVASDLDLAADMKADARSPSGSMLTFLLAAHDATVANTSRHHDASIVGAPLVTLAGDAPGLDLVDPARDLHVAIDVPDAAVADARVLAVYVPPTTALVIDAGRARANIHLDAWPAQNLAKGAATIEASELALRVAKKAPKLTADSVEARLVGEIRDRHASGVLDVNAPALGAALEHLALHAGVRAHARVRDWSYDDAALVLEDGSAHLTNVTATRPGSSQPALSVRTVDLSSDRFGFDAPLDHLVAHAALAGGVVRDARALDALLPNDASLLFDADPRGGTFAAELDASVDAHVARAHLVAHGHDVGVRSSLKPVRVHGDVKLLADIDQWRLDRGTMRVRVARIGVTHARVALGEYHATPEPDVSADAVELRANAALLDLANPSLGAVDYRVIVQNARIHDASRLSLLLGPSRSADPPAFAIESGTGAASMDVTVTASAKTATGGARIVLQNAGVRLHKTTMQGDFEVVANVKGLVADPREPRAGADHDDTAFLDLAGSRVVVHGVQTQGASAVASSWDAKIDLLRGAVRLSEAPAFDGFAQVHADDATPILALALGSSVPKPVVGLIDAPRLSGQARITVEPGGAAIRGAHFGGGDVDAFGEYVVRGPHVRGVVTIAKGPVSAGVKLDDRGTWLRFWGLRGWSERETKEIEAFWAAPPLTPLPVATKVPDEPRSQSRSARHR